MIEKKLKDMVARVLLEVGKKSGDPDLQFLANYSDLDIEYTPCGGVDLKTHRRLRVLTASLRCNEIDKKETDRLVIYRRTNKTLRYTVTIIWSDDARAPKLIKTGCIELLTKLAEQFDLSLEDFKFLCRINNPKAFKKISRTKRKQAKH